MSTDSVPYGGVIEIAGKFYSPGPEADRARAREEAKAAQRAEREAAAEAERARVERLSRRHAPLLEAWPAVRRDLAQRREDARERLVAAVRDDAVFSAFVDLLAAERAEHEGERDVRSARSSIDNKPRGMGAVAHSDLLEVLREMAEASAPGVLAKARAAAKAY